MSSAGPRPKSGHGNPRPEPAAPLSEGGSAGLHRAGVDAKWLVLLAVGVGTFMSALDSSVANTLLPVISHALDTNIATIQWIVTVYLLVVSGLLLSFGRLGDMLTHKPVYVSGFGLFVVGSFLSGAAPSAGALAAFRGIQAVGGAMLFSNGAAILIRSFPAAQRGQALGLQATMTYLGLTAGPALGGWLAQQYSWRSIFYVNVPIGVLSLLLSLRFIPNEVRALRDERFDVVGALAFLLGLTALLLGLNQGHTWGWGAPPTLGLILLSLLILGIFVVIELRVPAPMLDLSLFRRRLFAAATGSALLNYVALYSVVFLLPFYLIDARGLTPSQAGLILSTQPLIMAIAAPISGTLSDRIGSRAPATLGMLCMASGLWLLSRLTPVSPYTDVMLALALVGLGTGVFISPNSSALLGSAPFQRRGIASGILATARNVGMVLGVGLAGAILTTAQTQYGAGGDAGIYAGVSAGFIAGSVAALLAAVTSVVRGGR